MNPDDIIRIVDTLIEHHANALIVIIVIWALK